MKDIPSEMYDFVADITSNIVMASQADDEVLRESLFERLSAYYQDLAERNCLHPFVVETLADFTHDPHEAVRLYDQALALSDSDDPWHTILIYQGRAFLALGNESRALEVLTRARDEAARQHDDYYLKEAETLLAEFSSNGILLSRKRECTQGV